MKIEKLSLTNYRNLQHVDIQFGKSLTVFIGHNGVGKTNLLSALKQCFGFVFSMKSGTQQYEFIASSDQRIKSFKSTDATFSLEKGDYLYPLELAAEAEMSNGEKISWSMFKETGGKGLSDSKFASARDSFWSLHKKTESLPVLAFFSDSYPHVLTKLGTKMQSMLDSPFDLPRNVAYYKWDDEQNCQEIWLQYFRKQWKQAKWNEDGESARVVEMINNVMRKFTHEGDSCDTIPEFAIKEVSVAPRGSEDKVVVVFENGDIIPFDQLPQGYNRLLSIVFDIACRAYLLGCIGNVHGVCIIDEVELHLHPRLAQEAMTRLMNTFPAMQFIVSTHSPLVMTNIFLDDGVEIKDRKSIIYRMGRNTMGSFKKTELENIYGLDVNTVLEQYMETPVVESDLKSLKDAYLYWKNGGNIEKANLLLDIIGKKVNKKSTFYTTLVG